MGMLDLLRSLEWYTDGTDPYRCPSCQGYKVDGHTPDCRLDRAIRELALHRDAWGRLWRMTPEGPVPVEEDWRGAKPSPPLVVGDRVVALTPHGWVDAQVLQVEPSGPVLIRTESGVSWLVERERIHRKDQTSEPTPTDPSALVAWLYARVVPGRTAVEYRTAAGIVGKSLVVRCYAGTDRVALGIYGGETVLVPGQGSTLLTFTRLLNPDGTVLWEQK